jgi:hypothetical protein
MQRNFLKTIGNITYLTGVHLADKESNFLLYTKYEGLPSDCKMDADKRKSET